MRPLMNDELNVSEQLRAALEPRAFDSDRAARKVEELISCLIAVRRREMRDMTGDRSPACKGRRVEQELVAQLLELGLACARVPLSGAAGANSPATSISKFAATSCAWKSNRAADSARCTCGWPRAELLVLKGGRVLALVVLPLTQFAK